MQEYLLPGEESLSMTDEQMIFAIRNRMVYIEHNFPKKRPNWKEMYLWRHREYETFVFMQEIEYWKMKTHYGEDMRKMKIVFKRFKSDLEKCKNMGESAMGSSFVDPLYNGNKLTN